MPALHLTFNFAHLLRRKRVARGREDREDACLFISSLFFSPSLSRKLRLKPDFTPNKGSSVEGGFVSAGVC